MWPSAVGYSSVARVEPDVVQMRTPAMARRHINHAARWAPARALETCVDVEAKAIRSRYLDRYGGAPLAVPLAIGYS